MPILRLIASVAWKAIVVVLTLLGLSSYFAYTTAGFDFEVPTANGIDVRYARLRWDDGSTWVGFAIQPARRPARELDWFDPGGTILATPTRPMHRTRWNDLGFWHVDGPSDDPYVAPRYAGATTSRWWACPSWLVLVGLWHRAAWRALSWVGRRRVGLGLGESSWTSASVGGASLDREPEASRA